MRLAGIVAGQGPNGDVAAFDDMVIQTLIQREVGTERLARRRAASRPSCSRSSSRAAGPSACSTSCCAWAPTATASAPIPTGSRSTCSSRARTAWTSARSQPRLPEVLRTASGKIELAPEAIVGDMDRLRAAMARERNGGFVLIGRRQLRSNNSWMHNLPALVKGKERCTLLRAPGRRRAARAGRRRARDA